MVCEHMYSFFHFGQWIAYKLHIQVVEVVIEIAFERMVRVNISEGRTQPIGAE
jgi:hypothetical protein